MAGVRQGTGSRGRIVAITGGLEARSGRSGGRGERLTSQVPRHLWGWQAVNARHIQRGEPPYPFEERPVQPTRHRRFRHLESNLLGIPNHFWP